jgi:hypothetical protein
MEATTSRIEGIKEGRNKSESKKESLIIYAVPVDYVVKTLTLTSTLFQ